MHKTLSVAILWCLTWLLFTTTAMANTSSIKMGINEHQTIKFNTSLADAMSNDPRVANVSASKNSLDIHTGSTAGTALLQYRLVTESSYRTLLIVVDQHQVANDRPMPASERRARQPVISPLNSHPLNSKTHIQISVNEQHLLNVSGSIQRVSLGSDKTVSVIPINQNQLRLTGIASGTDVLYVWIDDRQNPLTYSVEVWPANATSIASNYEVETLSDTAIISGTSRSLEDHEAVNRMLNGVMDLTTFEDIQIQTDIRIVEINRRRLMTSGFFVGSASGNAFGVGGSGNILSFLSGQPVTPSADGFSLVRTNSSDVFSALSVLNRNGFARVLAEPSLVSLSGHPASFLAGGEFPFPRSNSSGDISIEFREFGVRLQLTAYVLDSQRIQLKVSPEVSEPDFSRGLQTGGVVVPALNTRRTETTVQMGNGESFIISGLISRNIQQNVDKIPGLGDLPFIGAFFRSNRFEMEEKELVMIVTPTIVQPIAVGAHEIDLPGSYLDDIQPNYFEMLFAPDPARVIHQRNAFGFAE